MATVVIILKQKQKRKLVALAKNASTMKSGDTHTPAHVCCMHLHICVCTRGAVSGDRWLTSGVFLTRSLPYLPRQGLLLNLLFTNSARLTSQQSLGICHLSPTELLNYSTPACVVYGCYEFKVQSSCLNRTRLTHGAISLAQE